MLLILADRGVIERAQERCTALEFLEQALVIDIEVEVLRRGVKICAVDEDGEFGHGSKNNVQAA